MDSRHFLNFLVATTEGILYKLYKHVLTIANIGDTFIHPMQLHSISSKPISSIYEGFHTWGWMIWASYFRKPSYSSWNLHISVLNSCCSWPSPPRVAPGNRLPFVPFAQMLQHSLRICRVLALRGSRLAVLLGPNNSGKRCHGVPRCHRERFMSWARDPLVI